MNLDELREYRNDCMEAGRRYQIVDWAIAEIERLQHEVERLQHEYDMHEDFTEDEDLWVKPSAIEFDGLASAKARAAIFHLPKEPDG